MKTIKFVNIQDNEDMAQSKKMQDRQIIHLKFFIFLLSEKLPLSNSEND